MENQLAVPGDGGRSVAAMNSRCVCSSVAFAMSVISAHIPAHGQSPKPAVPSNALEAIRSEVEAAGVTFHSDVHDMISDVGKHEINVIFIHVDWAFLEVHRKRFCEFCVEYRRKHPKSKLVFHYVDCTAITAGYEPLRSFPGWKRLKGAPPRSLIHGHGEIAWVQNDSVLQVDPIIRHGTAHDLISTTDLLFTPKKHRTNQ